MSKRLTVEEFVEKARKIHGNKFIYHDDYVNTSTKVRITCPIHGDFYQTPNAHLQGQQCPLCAHRSYKYTLDEWINEARKIHGNKYIYSNTKYKNNKTKVCIICPIHGEFWQLPKEHLRGCGCPYCRGFHKTTESVIEEFKKVHGDKYDYSKVVYINTDIPVCVICKEHGEFWITPHRHLNGGGCSKCYGNAIKTTEQFINEARAIYGDKYIYLNTKYKNSKTKVCVICPIHGEFWITPNNHLSKKQGCPICKQSKMEIEVYDFLTTNGIKFELQQKFDWLFKENELRLDFYLPDYNIAIECQGIQHFKSTCFGCKDVNKVQKEFIKIQERDKIKKQLCEKHEIKLLYYSNLKEYNEFLGEKVYHNLSELTNLL